MPADPGRLARAVNQVDEIRKVFRARNPPEHTGSVPGDRSDPKRASSPVTFPYRPQLSIQPGSSSGGCGFDTK